MLDEDYGDITDPESGRDLKVSVTKQPGKTFADTKVTPRATQTPLSKDSSQAKQWLSSVPNIDDYEELLETEQIEKRVNDWLTGGSSSSASSEVGTIKGGTISKLATLEDDFESTPSRSTSKNVAPPSKKTFDDLDDAFADLEA
jgi:hypothetical protein